jgi:hypothetical protein
LPYHGDYRFLLWESQWTQQTKGFWTMLICWSKLQKGFQEESKIEWGIYTYP